MPDRANMGNALDLFYQWATGGQYHYNTLIQALNGDVTTAVLIVSLCSVVGVGYIFIAVRWFRESRTLSASEAKRAMNSLMWIFLLSAISGYLWPLIKVWYPVWRLQASLLLVLALHTWNFVLRPSWLAAIARHLKAGEGIVARNERMTHDIRRLKQHLEGRHDGERLESL